MSCATFVTPIETSAEQATSVCFTNSFTNVINLEKFVAPMCTATQQL